MKNVEYNYQRKANAYRVQAAKENFRVLDDAYQELDQTGGLSKATRGKLQAVNRADVDNYLAMARAYNETGVLDIDTYAAAPIPFPNMGVPQRHGGGGRSFQAPGQLGGMNASEFERYAAMGASVENPSWWEAKGGGGPKIFNWQPFGKEVKNKVSFYLDNTKAGGEEAYEYLTKGEASLYNALLAKDMEEGTGKSDAYLKEMQPTLSARKMEALQTQAAQDAQEHPVLASAGSIALSIPKGMGYLYSAGQDIAGQEVDPNDVRFAANRTQQAIRGTVSEGIKDGMASEKAGDAAAFLYNVGMSVGDSLLSKTIGMGSQAAALGIMGTGAAGDATLSAFDRGGTQEQAMAAGFWAGAAEVVFEKVSLEHFIKLTDPAIRGAFVKNALKQAGIEASEEIATEIANRISDNAVMGNLSEYNLALQSYMAQGMSQADAKKQANRDAAVQFGLAALGGFVSGAAAGVVGGIIGKARGAANQAGGPLETEQGPIVEEQAQPGPDALPAPGAGDTALGEAAAAGLETAPASQETWQRAVSPEAIAQNKASLREMPSVASLTGKEFPLGDKLIDRIVAYFNSLGNKAHNPMLGDVALTRRGAKDSLAHGIGPEKSATFQAVPSVIEKGKVIDYQQNWKDGTHDRITLAAPVNIGDRRNYVYVILKKDANTQRYYLHEVLQQKESPSTPFMTGAAVNSSIHGGGETPSLINILDESLGVNTPNAAFKQESSGIAGPSGQAGPFVPLPIPSQAGAVQNEGAAPFKAGAAETGIPSDAVAPSATTIGDAGRVATGAQEPLVPPIPGQVAVKDIGAKVKAYKNAHEAAFVKQMGEILQIPDSQHPEIRASLSELGMRVIRAGTLGEADKQALFNQMYQGGSEPGSPMRGEAYRQFENALFDLRKKLNLAQRYEARQIALKDRKAKAQWQAEQMPVVKEAYTRQKGLRAAMEKAGGVLTDADKTLVTAIQGGSATLGQFTDRNDFDQLKAYLTAKTAYDDNQAIIDAYTRQRKGALAQQALEAIDESDQWKDKKAGLAYMRETQERNQLDINKNEASATLVNETYFAPVHENEAQKTRMINRLAKRMQSTGLNQYEQQAAQMLHEMGDLSQRLDAATQGERAMYEAALDAVTAKYKEIMAKHGGQVDVGKVWEALPVAYEIYDELFQAMNEAYIRNGYPPIPYRKNYLPHFFSGIKDPATAKICAYLGIQYIGDELPTDLAGLTSAFTPGRVWNGHALEREGAATQYGLYEGFDSYVRTAGDVIWHTDDIQRLRALENAIRYQYSDEGIKARMREIQGNSDLTPEEQQEIIARLSQGNTHLSNYVQNLNEYTNLLAGKKSIHDRGPENALGRKLYSVMNAAQSRVASNLIAGNISVATSNFVPLTQALGEVKPQTLLGAMRDTIKSYARSDGFTEQSDFLTNRRGTEQAYQTALDRANQTLSKPFELVDTFVADTLVRAKYAENITAGMAEGEALHQADTWAAGLMADRSKGAPPTLFSIKNPIVKAFTMFQLETNNQLSYLFKDLPRNLKEKGLGAIAAALFQIFVCAWAYNELDERITGNRRALDPIHILEEAVGGAQDVAAGKRKADEAVLGTWETIADTIPFAGSYLGGSGGRIPATAAVPQLWDIGKAYLDGDENLDTVARQELSKPFAYLLPPFGGGQLKKTWEGIEAVKRGGSFKVDKEGRERLQFETEQGPLDYAQAALFGKWALPQARAYVEADFPLLSAKDTAAWRAWQESGRDGTELLYYRQRFQRVTPLRDEAGEVVKSVPAQQREMLFENEALSTEDKALLDKLLISDNGEPKDYRSAAWFSLSNMQGNAYQDAQAAEKRGIPPEAYLAYLSAAKGLAADQDGKGNPIPGSKRAKVFRVIRSLGLTAAQQKWLAEEAGWE